MKENETSLEPSFNRYWKFKADTYIDKDYKKQKHFLSFQLDKNTLECDW
jgi:hypothetical protein